MSGNVDLVLQGTPREGPEAYKGSEQRQSDIEEIVRKFALAGKRKSGKPFGANLELVGEKGALTPSQFMLLFQGCAEAWEKEQESDVGSALGDSDGPADRFGPAPFGGQGGSRRGRSRRSRSRKNMKRRARRSRKRRR